MIAQFPADSQKRRYAATWAVLFLSAGGSFFWAVEGRSYVRRHWLAPAAAPESQRTGRQFVALLFPKITAKPAKYAMSAADLETVLGGLAARGYTTIGLQDLRDLYAHGRTLPSRALLIGFEDYPRSVELADETLKRLRMRAVLFISRTASAGGIEERRYLSRHAFNQLVKGGAWDAAWVEPGSHAAGASGELRFIRSEGALNDDHDAPDGLHIMPLRSDATPAELEAVVDRAGPRESEFVADLSSAKLGLDWIPVWGVSSIKDGRLALIQTPRNTGASLSLRGTDKWRDAAVEFDLKAYKSEFWAYARCKDDGSFVRAGASGGFWYVEQKIGAGRPRRLGRVPIRGPLPARVRLILKDDWAILHVDGRMQFGRALPVDPRIDRGLVRLGVYDAGDRPAKAVLTSFRAAPIGPRWILLEGGAAPSSDESLKEFREQAAAASVISPRWISIGPGGEVSVFGDEQGLLRALAGFYRCRLIPAARLPDAPLLGNGASTSRLAARLAAATAGLEAEGLNLRLSPVQARRPETIRFLAVLRADLRARGRRLWVALEDAAAQPNLRESADGVLAPAGRGAAGWSLFMTALSEGRRT